MRKIVNGLLYDSETAVCVASYSFGLLGEPTSYSESLFRTSKGNWFLCGAGGPQSPYPGREDLLPLSAFDAKNWLDAKGYIEPRERIFGRVEAA